MRALYFFMLLFASLLVELLAGSFGLPLFLPALVLYYIALSGPSGTAFYLAILYGAVLDLIYARMLPTTAVILVVSLLVARLARLKSPTHPFETALPGMGATLAALLGGALVRLALTNEPEALGTFFWQLIFFGALGLFLMPLLTLVFDHIGRSLGLSGALREPKSTFDRLRPRRVREPRAGRQP